MFERLLSKYLPLIVGVIFLGLGIKITYHIVDSTASLAEKGWKPAMAFVVVIFILISILLIKLRKWLENSKNPKVEQVDEQITVQEKKGKLQEKMAIHNVEEKTKKLAKNLVVSVFGVSKVGKSSIIKELIRFSDKDSEGQTCIDLQETPAITVDKDRNKQIIEKYKECRLALLVIDDDLTSYEWDVLYHLINLGLYVILTQNKTDLLSGIQIKEIEQSIKQKIEEMQDHQRCSFLHVTASPKPMIVIIQASDGSEAEEERTPEADCKSLLHGIKSYISQQGNNSSIKFIKTTGN